MPAPCAKTAILVTWASSQARSGWLLIGMVASQLCSFSSTAALLGDDGGWPPPDKQAAFDASRNGGRNASESCPFAANRMVAIVGDGQGAGADAPLHITGAGDDFKRGGARATCGMCNGRSLKDQVLASAGNDTSGCPVEAKALKERLGEALSDHRAGGNAT